MLAAKREVRKHVARTGNATLDGVTASEANSDSAGSHDRDGEHDNVTIFPLAIPLLAGPSVIISVIVVTDDFASSLGSTVKGYLLLIAVLVTIGMTLWADVVADTWIDERISIVFSRTTAIIFAGLSVQYVIDGLVII